MTRIFLLLAAVSAIFSVAGSAIAADLKAALHERYDAMKVAMGAHDKVALAAIIAPDFTSVDISGQTETGAQMIAEVDSLQPDPNKTSTTTLISVTQDGETAVVDQRYDMKTRKAGADGVEHNIELVTVSTDTWVRSAQAWLVQRTVTKEVSYYRDGQLVAHKVAP